MRIRNTRPKCRTARRAPANRSRKDRGVEDALLDLEAAALELTVDHRKKRWAKVQLARLRDAIRELDCIDGKRGVV